MPAQRLATVPTIFCSALEQSGKIGIKVGLGKLTLSMPFGAWMARAISDLRLEVLPVTVEYVELASTLPMHHRDPFDRLLAAQALTEKISVVSGDDVFDRYGISRVW